MQDYTEDVNTIVQLIVVTPTEPCPGGRWRWESTTLTSERDLLSGGDTRILGFYQPNGRCFHFEGVRVRHGSGRVAHGTRVVPGVFELEVFDAQSRELGTVGDVDVSCLTQRLSVFQPRE